MSEVAQRATVTILVSDFANNDASGKLNVLGGTVAIVGFDAMQGLTSRFTLTVVVNVPTQLLPTDFSLEIGLLSNGELVQLPGAAGPQPLRVAQPISMERSQTAPNPAIRDHIGSNHVAVLDFATGLPLAVGGLYEWLVRIDGDDGRTWSYPFAVVGPPSGPVFG